MPKRSLNFWRALVLREVRENKYKVVYSPVIVLALALLASVQLFTFLGVEKRRVALELVFNGLEGMNAADFAPLLTAGSGLYMLVMIVNVLGYLASSLYADRRDSSFLFWQSMPVSDTQTVLSKVLMAVLVIPCAYCLALIFAALVGLLSAAGYAATIGIEFQGVVELMTLVAVSIWLTLLSSLVTMLWLLPAMGWMLFFSSFVERAPFVLALACLLGLPILESVLLGTQTLETWLSSRSSPWQFFAFSLDDAAARVLSYEMFFGVLISGLLISGAIAMRRLAN